MSVADHRVFRRACHEAARRTGGRVIEFRVADGVTPNFHQAMIAYHDRVVAVVLGRDHAVGAVAEPRVDDPADTSQLTFVDAPELEDVLAEVGLRVLPTRELDRPFDSAEWPHIGPSDVKYWRPTTVGEALFNHWD